MDNRLEAIYDEVISKYDNLHVTRLDLNNRVTTFVWRSLNSKECLFILSQNDIPDITRPDIEEFVFLKAVMTVQMDGKEYGPGIAEILPFGHVSGIARLICIYSAVTPSKLFTRKKEHNYVDLIAQKNVLANSDKYILFGKIMTMFRNYSLEDLEKKDPKEIKKLEAVALLVAADKMREVQQEM